MKSNRTNKRRIWTKDEQIVAYYLARYGEAGLLLGKEDIVDYVLVDSSKASLSMQIANYEYILGIDLTRLKDASKLQIEIHQEFKNYTTTQLRKVVNNYIESKSETISSAKNRKINSNVEKKKDQANEALNQVFENKLASIKKHRRLRKL